MYNVRPDGREQLMRDLLDGLIAHREELGELGRRLEEMLRAAGVTPSPGWQPGTWHAPPADPEHH